MERYKSAKTATWIGLGINLALGVGKIVTGIVAHSQALRADGVHSLTDCATSIAVIIGIIVAARPADKSHPYGHGRAEAISGKIVAIALIVVAVALAYNSICAIVHQEFAQPPCSLAIWVAAASIVIKEGMFFYKSRIAKTTGSTAIEADAWHHRSDSLSSLVVLVGLVLVAILGKDWIIFDHIAAIFVAAVIFFVAVKLLLKTWNELMDGAAPESTIEQVRRLAADIDGVLGVEKVRARKSGMDIYIDIHIEVDPHLTVKDGHEIAGAVKWKIIKSMKAARGVLVHVEPFGDKTEPNII